MPGYFPGKTPLVVCIQGCSPGTVPHTLVQIVVECIQLGKCSKHTGVTSVTSVWRNSLLVVQSSEALTGKVTFTDLKGTVVMYEVHDLFN